MEEIDSFCMFLLTFILIIALGPFGIILCIFIIIAAIAKENEESKSRQPNPQPTPEMNVNVYVNDQGQYHPFNNRFSYPQAMKP